MHIVYNDPMPFKCWPVSYTMARHRTNARYTDTLPINGGRRRRWAIISPESDQHLVFAGATFACTKNQHVPTSVYRGGDIIKLQSNQISLKFMECLVLDVQLIKN